MQEAAPFVETYVAPLLADHNGPVAGDAARDLVRRYVDRYGERELELGALAAYDAPRILGQAIQEAGTVEDTAKLAQVLRDGEWETVWSRQWGKARFAGRQTFGLAQLLEQPVFLSRLESGRVVTFRAMQGTLP